MLIIAFIRFLFYLGDASYIDQWLSKLFIALQQSNVKISCVQDAPVSIVKKKEKDHMKETTWTIRKEEKLKKKQKVLQTVFSSFTTGAANGILDNNWKGDQMVRNGYPIFPLAEQQIYLTLKRYSIKVITAPGEAEAYIADMIRKGEYMYAISRDSDFFIMKDARYIPLNELSISEGEEGGNEKPSVVGRVYTAEKLAACLNVSVSNLVDVSIFCGNDFSDPLFNQFNFSKLLNSPTRLQENGSYKGYNIGLIASWVKMSFGVKSMFDDPKVLAILASRPNAAGLLSDIYEFYGYIEAIPSVYLNKKSKDPDVKLFKVLDDAGIPKSFFSVHIHGKQHGYKGFECHDQNLIFSDEDEKDNGIERIVLQDPFPTIDDLLVDIRRVYSYLLNWNISHEEKLYSKRLQKHRKIKNYICYNEIRQMVGYPFNSTSLKTSATTNLQTYNALIQFLSRHIRPMLIKTQYKDKSILNVYGANPYRSPYGRENEFIFSCALSLANGIESFKKRIRGSAKHSFMDLYATRVGRFGWLEIELLVLSSVIQSQLSGVVPDNSTSSPKPHYHKGNMDMGIEQVNKTMGILHNGLDIHLATIAQWYASHIGSLLHIRQLLHLDNRALEPKRIFSGALLWDLFSNSCICRKEVKVKAAKKKGGYVKPQMLPKPKLCRDSVAFEISRRFTDSRKAHECFLRFNGIMTQLGARTGPKDTKSIGNGLIRLAPAFSPSVSYKKMNLAKCIRKVSPSNWQIEFSRYRNIPVVPTRPPLPPGSNVVGIETPGQLITVEKEGVDKRKESPITMNKTKTAVVEERKPAAVKYETPVKVIPTRSNQMLVPCQVVPSVGLNPLYGNNTPRTIHNTHPRTKLSSLPIYAHQSKIVQAIRSHRVTIIEGETGSGKSTAVPQFVLDDCIARGESSSVNIYVTQPRRIAAITLANQVSNIRNESLGKTVGYRIGQVSQASRDTKITFVTTGYLLEHIRNNPEVLTKTSHLILDEVHERSLDADLFILIVKLLLPKNPLLKIVIMSATLDIGVFKDYFVIPNESIAEECAELFVGAKMFPVKDVYLEELLTQMKTDAPKDCIRSLMGEIKRNLPKTVKSSGMMTQVRQQVLSLQKELIVHIIHSFITNQYSSMENSNVKQAASTEEEEESEASSIFGECILVFLPGKNEIGDVHDTLSTASWASDLDIFVLHSELEVDQQKTAFQNGSERKLKVVLATNIAESSVTIPNVTVVINMGIEKQVQYFASSNTEILMRQWCSKASVAQRKGRAGRLLPGTAYHLFDKAFHDTHMVQHATPEMLRKSLDRIVLALKTSMDSFGTPTELLEQALNHPKTANISTAIKYLFESGALVEPSETSEVTSFGYAAADFPFDIQLTKLLFSGIAFGCIVDAIILAAILSARQELFVFASKYFEKTPADFLIAMRNNVDARWRIDQFMESEPLSIWNLVRETIVSPTEKLQAKKRQLSFMRFKDLITNISDISSKLLKILQKEHSSFGTISNILQFELKQLEKISNLNARARSAVCSSLELTGDLDTVRFLLVLNSFGNLVVGSYTPKKDILDSTDVVLRCNRGELSGVSNEQLVASLACTCSEDYEIEKVYESASSVLVSYRCISGTKVANGAEEMKEGMDMSSGGNSAIQKKSNHGRLALPVAGLYFATEGRLPFDIDIIKSEMDMKRMRIRCPSQHGKIKWQLMSKANCQVTPRSRSVFALPVTEEDCEHMRWAVVNNTMYNEQMDQVQGSSWTMLPTLKHPWYVPVILLTMSSLEDGVWVHIDESYQWIRAIKVGNKRYELKRGQYFPAQHIALVNKIRNALNETLACTSAEVLIMKNDIKELLDHNSIQEQVTLNKSCINTWYWNQLTRKGTEKGSTMTNSALSYPLYKMIEG